jgi:hypothetical protein
MGSIVFSSKAMVSNVFSSKAMGSNVFSSKAMGSNEIFLKPKCELLNDQNMIPRYALKGDDVIYFRFRNKIVFNIQIMLLVNYVGFFLINQIFKENKLL